MGCTWLHGREKDGNAVDGHGNDANEHEDDADEPRNDADEHEDDNGFPPAASGVDGLKFLQTLTGSEIIP